MSIMELEKKLFFLSQVKAELKKMGVVLPFLTLKLIETHAIASRKIISQNLSLTNRNIFTKKNVGQIIIKQTRYYFENLQSLFYYKI